MINQKEEFLAATKELDHQASYGYEDWR